jgi:serine/threonine protein phosphatase PrpC
MASHNEFTDILPYTGNQIEDYIMPYNKITRIDVRLLGDALVRLDLSDNRITALPAELFRLPKLDIVILARNHITSIPEQWRASGATTFNISCNPLQRLPKRWPAQLKRLLISYCGLSALPDRLSSLLQLEELCACGNSLSTIPFIKNCRIFYLSRNKFEKMPLVPQSTVILDLAMNGLLQLPALVLPALQELDVSQNDITELPTMRLPALTCLKVSHNPRLSSQIVVGDFLLLHAVNVKETQILFSDVPRLRELMTSQQELFTGSTVKYADAGDGVGFAEMTGLRGRMADSILVREGFESNASLFGVFDGHGGARTAVFAAYIFAKYLHGRELTPATLQEIFGQANELIRSTKCRDGATAVVAIRQPNRVICGHLGDARLVIVRDDGTVKFQTEDHKPQLRREFERIRDEGSKVVSGRTAGILAASRAIGDFLVPGVGRAPEIAEIPLEESDRWLILACDGVWDVIFNECLGDLARNAKNAKEFAGDLRNIAYVMASMDNISTIVVDLRWRRSLTFKEPNRLRSSDSRSSPRSPRRRSSRSKTPARRAGRRSSTTSGATMMTARSNQKFMPLICETFVVHDFRVMSSRIPFFKSSPNAGTISVRSSNSISKFRSSSEPSASLRGNRKSTHFRAMSIVREYYEERARTEIGHTTSSVSIASIQSNRSNS